MNARQHAPSHLHPHHPGDHPTPATPGDQGLVVNSSDVIPDDIWACQGLRPTPTSA
jgi:hypothetical protein